MSNIWFTSDLHLGHEKVATLRGFDSVAEHDRAIMDNWESVVGECDQVYVLGDLVGDTRTTDTALLKLRWLSGVKHLVAGNHDKVHPMNRKGYKHMEDYLQTFDSVQPFAKVKIGSRPVLLSHFPYDEEGGDRGENRHRQWRLPNLGEWLLHGHTHIEDQRVHGRQIHVGLDAWDLKPVSMGAITGLINAAELADRVMPLADIAPFLRQQDRAISELVALSAKAGV